MNWIHNYQLFLFDFDGLLVNTEEIHFKAYQQMCEKYGFQLNWSFDRYCQIAHYSAEGLKNEIYRDFPDLYRIEPDWNTLYAFKRERVIELLKHDTQLMPGVKELLEALNQAQIKRCVVTHSPQLLVETVRRQHPILQTIPYWITREHYTHPKPHPEGYLTAIQQFAAPTDRIIGFEDTPRGFEALRQTPAEPILIATTHYPSLPATIKRFPSFKEMNITAEMINHIK